MIRFVFKSQGLFSLLVLALILVSPVQAAHQAIEDWTPVGNGIDYKEFILPDPNHVYVARMDRSNFDAIIDSSIAQGRLSGGTETVLNQAHRYNEAINYWGNADDHTTSDPYWGSRNKVVAAINGFYFPYSTGIPYQGQVQSGWYAKRFDDFEIGSDSGSGFAWQLDRYAFIGECVRHIADRQLVSYHTTLTNTITAQFDGINIARGDDELIVYTPQYDRATPANDSGTEVLVQMSKPDLIINATDTVTGTVKLIKEGVNSGSTPIPFDAIVLSASGSKEAFLQALQPGDVVSISQEITRCSNQYPKVDWTKTYASVGGGPYFLKDNVITTYDPEKYPSLVVPAPRTAIAYNDNYIYFIVVDGRNPLRSVGMNMEQLGLFARDVLSATNGVAQDGGGSSTMVINDQVVNDTYCNDGNCRYHALLPLVANTGSSALPLNQPQNGNAAAAPRPFMPRLALSTTNEDQNLSAPFVQSARSVANGMMMINVEPITRSLTLTPTEVVTTSVATDVRLGPGTNYAVLELVQSNVQGIVLDSGKGLNGVLAKGSYWWKVNFNGLEGWVPEENLKPLAPP